MGDAGAKSGAKDFGERVPDFLIIGAKRSGTTWLNSMLEEHPEIYIGTKEIHYFDYQLDKGDGWYRAHFADAGPAQLAGEATQTYMFDREVPPEMARLVPEAKLIAALRNPVDRAYSDYWYNRARGIEDLSFEDALEAEGERGERYRKSYFSRGLYASQLRRVAEFYRRDQIAVFIFEEQVADPEHAYRGVCRYLGIDADFIPRTLGRPVNPTIQFRSLRFRALTNRSRSRVAKGLARLNQKHVGYAAMASRTRAALQERFAQANADLADWLGRDLEVWREVTSAVDSAPDR